MFDKLINWISPDNRTQKKIIKKLQSQVAQINQAATNMNLDNIISYSEMKSFVSGYLKQNNRDTIKDFAVIRKAAEIALNQKHYDVQLMGGLVLDDGQIAEMKTGEGKTLTSTLPIIHQALQGNKVHVVTTNDYLAHRDATELKPLYDLFGLSVSFNETATHEKKIDKKTVFQADIIYSSAAELCFDYLRNQIVSDKDKKYMTDKSFGYVLIDEADSILIDEAKNPMILSRENDYDSDFIAQAKHIVDNVIEKSEIDEIIYDNQYMEVESLLYLSEEELKKRKIDKGQIVKKDYFINLKDGTINMFETGYDKIEQYLIANHYITDKEELYSNQSHYMSLIENAIRAQYFFEKDIDYIVEDDQVKIIDSNTGRVKHGSRWQNGVHQAIELKEGVTIKKEHSILSKITYSNYFSLYKKRAGMTGTAYTEKKELYELYKMNVIVIPTNKPVARIDHPDKMFLNKEIKYKFLIEYIKEKHEHGQPILIGTADIVVSEEVAQKLKEAGLKFKLLNAKASMAEQESEIIKYAGVPYAITISTNMAGRGTDIKLVKPKHEEPNPFFDKVMELSKKNNFEEFEEFFQLYGDSKWLSDKTLEDLYVDYQIYEEHKTIEPVYDYVWKHGLCVIGVEKNLSRRIDNQLRGRAGRQGEAGESVFFVSLEDYLLEKNVKPEVLAFAKKFFANSPFKDKELEVGMTSWAKTISSNQEVIEAAYADQRKYVRTFDTAIHMQRMTVNKLRDDILFATNEQIEEMVLDYMYQFAKTLVFDDENTMVDTNERLRNKLVYEICDDSETEENLYVLNKIKTAVFIDENKDYNTEEEIDELLKHVRDFIFDSYRHFWNNMRLLDGGEPMKFERYMLLETLDKMWTQQLNEMDEQQRSVQYVARINKNPIIEFSNIAHHKFESLMEHYPIETVRNILQEKMNVQMLDINKLSVDDLPEDIANMNEDELKDAFGKLTNQLLKKRITELRS